MLLMRAFIGEDFFPAERLIEDQGWVSFAAAEMVKHSTRITKGTKAIRCNRIHHGGVSQQLGASQVHH